MWMSRSLWGLTIGGVLVTLLLLFGPIVGVEIPLGLPGEWTWARHPVDGGFSAGLFLGSLSAGAYAAFVAVGRWRLARLERLGGDDGCRLAIGTRAAVPSWGTWEPTVWVVALAAASWVWLWTVQETAPPAGQLTKAVFILYYPSSSGYFYKTAYEAPPVAQFLRQYEGLMREGDVLHVGTHPPGLFLFFYGIRAVVEYCPGLTAALRWSEPESVRTAFAVLEESVARSDRPLSGYDRATLWLAGLIALSGAAATVWPLYTLVRMTERPCVAWQAAALWPTLPAVALFVPKSDAVFPFVAASFVAVLAISVRRRSILWGLAAGVTVWCGLLCSLAFLPVGLFVVLAIVAVERYRLVTEWRGQARWLSGAATGFGGMTIAFGTLTGCWLPVVWVWNYLNHAGFYQHYPRSYGAWVLVNPLELSLAVGVPLAIVATVTAIVAIRELWSRSEPAAETVTGVPEVRSEELSLVDRARRRASRQVARVLSCGVAVWGLLWITGKNSGEAARLWLLLMPGIVWAAGVSTRWLTWPGGWAVSLPHDRFRSAVSSRGAAAAATPNNAGTPRTGHHHWHWDWLVWFGLQLAMGLLTVHGVSGFHFGNTG